MSGVLLAYITGERVTSQFHLSVCRSLQAHPELIEGHLGVEGVGIALNRNLVVHNFMATGIDWLWSVDDDVMCTPEVLSHLLAVAQDPFKGIICAAYFGRNGYPMWTQERDGDEYANVEKVEPGALYRLSACGMGCTLIHRSVFERIAAAPVDPRDPDPWYGYDLVPRPDGSYRRAGEDTTFCRRAAALGIETWGLGHVVGHIKPVILGE